MPSVSSVEPSLVAERDYLAALSRFIKTHEAALAAYYTPRSKHKSHAPPSWTTVLTLGIVPTADSPSPPPPPPRRPPLVLNFDPHHLYYLLLRFDELGIPNTGELDVPVEGGTTRPMMVDYSSVPGGRAPGGGGGSLLGGIPGAGMLGFPSSSSGDDSRSIRSGISSFSFGSGWWGLGSGAQAPTKDEEAANVRYIYSSCTKLPALKLSPFHLVAADGTPTLACAVEGFVDCPPPATCVPLLAFKNLTALTLEDLDPRGFVGWDVLSVQLRSLEVRRGGIEDVGELICDAPSEDSARRSEEERRHKPVGTERKRRAEGVSKTSLAVETSSASALPLDGANGEHGDGEVGERRPASPRTSAAYATPPRLAWSSLRHLALPDNSLTFVPSLPLTFLPTLTSLDLSSNLLISIPPALAHLTSLRSLNLSDNMIDSLLGIAKALGAITALNLSRNRLENFSGLDRLAALERLDVRDNAVADVLEVSRLSRLPHVREVYVRGNAFTRPREEGGDEQWRVKSWGYFVEEDVQGHRDVPAAEVRLDGALMTGSERRAVEADFGRRGTPLSSRGRRASAGAADRPAENGQAKVVVGRRVVTAPHRQHRERSPPPPLPSAAHLAPSTAAAVAGDTASIASASSAPRPLSPSKVHHKARRKPRRIVDLDADPSHPSTSSLAPARPASDSDQPSSSGAEHSGSSRLQGLAVSGDADAGHYSSDAQSSSPARARSAVRFLGPAAAGGAAAPAGSSSTAARRTARRQLSASTFNVPADGSGAESGGGGEALRRRIEALRDEVGESWLSVLGEREARDVEARQAPQEPVAKREEKQASGASEQAGQGSERRAEQGPPAPVAVEEAVPPPAAEDEAAAAVPTTVKSVRKKKYKGGKKKGGR
ncbi:hypothetical protein JCM3775_005613 [Rhodotorula graminis]